MKADKQEKEQVVLEKLTAIIIEVMEIAEEHRNVAFQLDLLKVYLAGIKFNKDLARKKNK